MPGIHVRSLGKLDWVERGNEPILAIPGAYWLCHKKHIYKFTFKWHKTLRNTSGFDYPKELTKVIRRIIKSQPRQGQQFGTRHLLVTYNHSAWMRQDKMFAMLKFRDRTDATAFHHAFILTVKTLNVPTTEESCPRDKVDDSSRSNSSVSRNRPLQGISDASKDDPGNFDKVSISDSASETSSRNKNEPKTERKKDPGKKTKKRQKSLDNIESSPPMKKHNRRGQAVSGKKKDEEQPESPIREGVPGESADLPYQYIIEKEIEESKGVPGEHCLSVLEADSISGLSDGHSQSSIHGKLLARSPRGVQTDTMRSADITDLVMEGLMFTIRQDQDSVTVVEQKTKLEMDEVLENSEKAETKEGEKCLLNSSLLRLENLITKIEMSEVRMKSKEEIPHAPPAIASRKEELLDVPVEKLPSGGSSDSPTNCDETSRKCVKASPQLRSFGQSPTSKMPEFPLVKINLSNVEEVLNDKLAFDLVASRRETDGVHGEAMVTDEATHECRNGDEKFERAMEDEEEEEVGLELKYEEKDDSEANREEKEEDERKDDNDCGGKKDIVLGALEHESSRDFGMNMADTRSQRMLDLSSTPIKHCIEIIKSKTPRIVSNEVVTNDQIPPELQRALRYKRTKRLSFSNESEANIAEHTATMTTDDKAKHAIHPTQMELPIVPLVKLDKSRIQLIDESVNRKGSTVTIDVTEEFDRALPSEKRHKQPARRKSLRHADETSSTVNRATEKSEIRIEMWKFMQDITRGAKVVVHRLDLTNMPNGVATKSSLSKYNGNQRYPTKS